MIVTLTLTINRDFDYDCDRHRPNTTIQDIPVDLTVFLQIRPNIAYNATDALVSLISEWREVCVYIYVCVYVCICEYTYMAKSFKYVCMHIYIYIYTYTYSKLFAYHAPDALVSAISTRERYACAHTHDIHISHNSNGPT